MAVSLFVSSRKLAVNLERETKRSVAHQFDTDC